VRNLNFIKTPVKPGDCFFFIHIYIDFFIFLLFRMLSNITAGSTAQIQAVIDSGLTQPLIEALRAGDFKTRKEAAWAVSNLSTGGTVAQIRYLAEQGVIQPVIGMLSSQESRLLQICLECVSNLLRAGEMEDGSNPCATYIEECGGLDVIEGLQQHENAEVYNKALKIIERFFSGDEVCLLFD
jgi:hypothetical protein